MKLLMSHNEISNKTKQNKWIKHSQIVPPFHKVLVSCGRVIVHMSVTAWEIWQTVGVVCNLIYAHTAKFNFNLQSSNSSLIFNLTSLSFSLN